MIDYVRPAVVVEDYLDRDGSVIPYGRRWPENGGDGPDETYSVTQHPQRFRPLLVVAQAILEHLALTYDVSRTDTPTGAVLRPADPDAAPLVFTFTEGDEPWAQVRAGVDHELVVECGCDHCDCDVLDLVDSLEESVDAVLDGHLSEWLNEGERYDPDDLFVVHQVRGPDGETRESGSSEVTDEDAREQLRRRYAQVPERWAPWSLRRR